MSFGGGRDSDDIHESNGNGVKVQAYSNSSTANQPLVRQVGSNDAGTDRDSKSGKRVIDLKPMSPISASATIVNLLLATGPFTYPQGFV